MMLTHLGSWILEAAIRSLLMAVAVWAGIQIFRVQTVLAQKVAWVLVLLAAGAMPLVMHAPWLVWNRAMRLSIWPSPTKTQVVRPAVLEAVRSIPEGLASQELLEAAAKPSPAHPGSHLSARRAEPAPVLRRLTVVPPAPIAKPALPATANASASGGAFPDWTEVRDGLGLVYLVVAAILLLRILMGLAIALRVWNRARPVAGFAVGGKGLTAVRVSADIATPVTVGSTVILPLSYPEWDPAKLRIVLAHERSHVRQRDFHLQLLAALHAAVFWFSPLGWWLQRKLSELGEALSDRAGLEQAASPASYAQILLEFAAMPQTHPFSGPLTGVAMARTSNLSSRIERVLNTRLFQRAFHGKRRHALLACALVPGALFAVVACVRFVPAVEAARGQSESPQAGQMSGQATGQVSGQPSGQGATTLISGQVSGGIPEATPAVEPAPVVVPEPPVVPVAPNAPNSLSPPGAEIAPKISLSVTAAPDVNVALTPVPPLSTLQMESVDGDHVAFLYSSDDEGQDAYAIVRGNGNTVTVRPSPLHGGDAGKELDKVRRKVHGDFLWFEHDGKSYVITDPAAIAEGESVLKSNQLSAIDPEALGRMRAKLSADMLELRPEIEKAGIPGPEFQAEMAKLNAELGELQSDEFKKLTEEIAQEATENKALTDNVAKDLSQEKLDQLQERLSAVQEQIDRVEGSLAGRQALQMLTPEKQKEINERAARLGEEMGRVGERLHKMSQERMKSFLDHSIEDGKAQPIE